MLSTDIDGQDGAPVWACARGTELPGGFLAWHRLAVRPRCETWLVWSVPIWSPAVLKLARPHHIQDPRAARSLAREAAALDGNQHPALPRLYRDGTATKVPHIAIEYVDGPTLAEELYANGPLDEPEVALLGAQLLTALLALHQRGLVYANLKPENVVLRDQRPVLIDFASARPAGSRQPPRRPAGTPGYAAPELEACEPIAPTMDLYSLGAVLHEALTGRPVFDLAMETPAPRPLEWSPVTALVLALLDPDPARRPPTRDALITLASTVPDDLRPWPVWADSAAPHLAVPRNAASGRFNDPS